MFDCSVVKFVPLVHWDMQKNSLNIIYKMHTTANPKFQIKSQMERIIIHYYRENYTAMKMDVKRVTENSKYNVNQRSLTVTSL